MLSFKTCEKAPVPGGRGEWGGGLVEVEGRVVWGGDRGVYMYEEDRWSRVADGGLAKLFPIGKEADQSQKEADESVSSLEQPCWQDSPQTPPSQEGPPTATCQYRTADKPVRAISFFTGWWSVQEEDDWFVVEDDQALLKVVGSFPKMAIHVSSDGAGALHPDPTPAVSMLPWIPAQSRTVSIEEELIHHINHSSDKEKLFGVKWIQFIDSGGQLQYHDILPLFFQNPGVAIFVLNLSEELSHHPAIEYYGADGKPDARPLIITVGTHRDAADKCSESIKEKNLKLKALLDAGSFRILCNGERLKEVIFAVNGKTPQDEDRHVSKWFGLEVLLQRSSHDGILSLVECQVCAKSLHIEGDAFSAALHHLVHYNVFLHYPEILPQTVFCDPQVVLTKVTELVEYHHKLLHSPDEGVAAEERSGHIQGSWTVVSGAPEQVSKGITQKVCSLQKICEVIGECASDAMTSEGGEFLMPALLPHLDSGHVSKYHQQAVVVSAKKWKCSSRGHQSGDLSEGQLMWFGESGVRRQDPSTSDPVSLDTELQVIGPRHPTLEEHHRAFGEMFGVWRRRGSVPYTWRTLIDLLKSASVGEVRLSDELTSWITQ
eukprot:Em0363g2a